MKRKRKHEKHGLKNTRIGRIWSGMRTRCYNKKGQDYHLYGGRGIKICPRWRHSLLTFYRDMGEPPKEMVIDRIDNDGNYEPGNCRWTTQLINNRNRRSSVLITYKGKTQCISAWAEELNLPQWRLYARRRMGYSVEDIFELGPYQKRAGRNQ